MAEAEAPTSPSPPSWLEVKCKSSGKRRRFAVGTEAGFAVSVINRKLLVENERNNVNLSLALHIEALKEDDEDEEPITFGPNSPLVNYGQGWILHTVVSQHLHPSSNHPGVEDVMEDAKRVPPHVNGCENSAPTIRKVTKQAISFVYIGKIILAFIMLFLLGAIFTLALENLPLLVSHFSSSL